MKRYNLLNLGKYDCEKPHYANLIKQVSYKRNEQNVHMDLRLSIYGKSQDEIVDLATWFLNNELNKVPNVNWYIQIPRIPHIILKDEFKKNEVNYFQTFIKWLNNIFIPIKKAYETNNKLLIKFLNNIVGFDCVDNEDEPDETYYTEIGTYLNYLDIKNQVSKDRNPFTYAMYLYFIWYYLSEINHIIKNKRKIFKFIPHSGELGPLHHLLTAFLLSDSICHGNYLIDNKASKEYKPINVLKKNKNNVLLFLYCKTKFGCAMSPISNNYLSRNFKYSHINLLFDCGLKMSLTTDDPLMFHYSENPLLEEYINSKNIYNLTMTDLLEIINNSYSISGSTIKPVNLVTRYNIRNKLSKIY